VLGGIGGLTSQTRKPQVIKVNLITHHNTLQGGGDLGCKLFSVTGCFSIWAVFRYGLFFDMGCFSIWAVFRYGLFFDIGCFSDMGCFGKK
jgi:hypothetical protein